MVLTFFAVSILISHLNIIVRSLGSNHPFPEEAHSYSQIMRLLYLSKDEKSMCYKLLPSS